MPTLIYSFCFLSKLIQSAPLHTIETSNNLQKSFYSLEIYKTKVDYNNICFVMSTSSKRIKGPMQCQPCTSFSMKASMSFICKVYMAIKQETYLQGQEDLSTMIYESCTHPLLDPPGVRDMEYPSSKRNPKNLTTLQMFMHPSIVTCVYTLSVGKW